MLFFISEPSMDPHSLQNKVLERFPSPPYMMSTLWPPLPSSAMFQGHTTTFWVWVFLLSTFSLHGKPLPHLRRGTALTSSQVKFRGSQSQHPSTPLSTLVCIFITSLITEAPCNSTRPASAKWGFLRGKDSFWCIFTSPSPLSRFPVHREHSNICWKTAFHWILANWVSITLGWVYLANDDFLLLGFLRSYLARPHIFT